MQLLFMSSLFQYFNHNSGMHCCIVTSGHCRHHGNNVSMWHWRYLLWYSNATRKTWCPFGSHMIMSALSLWQQCYCLSNAALFISIIRQLFYIAPMSLTDSDVVIASHILLGHRCHHDVSCCYYYGAAAVTVVTLRLLCVWAGELDELDWGSRLDGRWGHAHGNQQVGGCIMALCIRNRWSRWAGPRCTAGPAWAERG